jgi:hypothetical protein
MPRLDPIEKDVDGRNKSGPDEAHRNETQASRVSIPVEAPQIERHVS